MAQRKKAQRARRKKSANETRADQNVRWIQTYCRVPEGSDVGKPVMLRPWQRDIIRRIYDNPHGTRRCIVSFGRKNGKSSLSAFILLLHLCGYEARANSQLYSAAQSRDQAALIFALAAKIVRMSVELSSVVTVRETAKQLVCNELGTMYRALSADASTAMGLSPVLCLHDELGQVRGPRSELYEALETATAAQANPLSVIISTQAATDGDLLSILIDDAKAEHDPRTVLALYTAEPSLDPFSREAVKAANPAFNDFQNAKEVMAMAESARRMPAAEAGFRNLVLNQRVAAATRFVSPNVWKGCNAKPKPFEGRQVYAGLDLSAVNDLTAFVLMFRDEGIWHVHPTFWLPADNIRERSATDRVPYDLWADQGYVELVPGKSVDYEYVARWLRDLFDRCDVLKIGFDRWGFNHLKSWLLNCGFEEEQIEKHFVEFGQGFQSMSPALRAFETELVNARIAHGGHPVLTMCADSAVVVTDPQNNRKLNKQKSVHRIDGLVALAMAFGVCAEPAAPPEPKYQMFILGGNDATQTRLQP
jgi:phage terminase large subunit-like protein